MKKVFYLTLLFFLCFTIIVQAYPYDGINTATLGYKITEITEKTEDIQMFKWVPLNEKLMEYIYTTCSEYGIDSSIFLALVHRETGGKFSTTLISKTNDRGLCQINKRYQNYNVKLVGLNTKTFDVFNPYHSVLFSVKLLAYLRQKYFREYAGNDLTAMMLSAYNYGMVGAERQKSEYTGYAKAVIKLSQIYKED